MPYHFLFKAYALKGTSGRFLAGSVEKTVGWSLKISKFGHLKILKIPKFSQKKKDLERAKNLTKGHVNNVSEWKTFYLGHHKHGC